MKAGQLITITELLFAGIVQIGKEELKILLVSVGFKGGIIIGLKVDFEVEFKVGLNVGLKVGFTSETTESIFFLIHGMYDAMRV